MSATTRLRGVGSGERGVGGGGCAGVMGEGGMYVWGGDGGGGVGQCMRGDRCLDGREYYR